MPYLMAAGRTQLSIGKVRALLALFTNFGLVQVQNLTDYRSRRPPLNAGLWARRLLSRNRFKSLIAMLHIVDPATEAAGDRLRKIQFKYEAIRWKCMEIYQSRQNISVDERMTRLKGHHHMKVFIKNKPTKWRFKSFALCDSLNLSLEL